MEGKCLKQGFHFIKESFDLFDLVLRSTSRLLEEVGEGLIHLFFSLLFLLIQVEVGQRCGKKHFK